MICGIVVISSSVVCISWSGQLVLENLGKGGSWNTGTLTQMFLLIKKIRKARPKENRLWCFRVLHCAFTLLNVWHILVFCAFFLFRIHFLFRCWSFTENKNHHLPVAAGEDTQKVKCFSFSIFSTVSVLCHNMLKFDCFDEQSSEKEFTPSWDVKIPQIRTDLFMILLADFFWLLLQF